ncbi:hypothetical protein JXR93_09695 [bacterium]|nr:hypothetical protein [bacterium]
MKGYLFILIIFSFLLSLTGCEEADKSIICALSGTVCGVDGVTYTNKCDADDAGVAVAYSGKCESPTECASNEDCPEGFICQPLLGCYIDVNGELVCPTGGQCVPQEEECVIASDCKGVLNIECEGAHWECQEGECVQECGSVCPEIDCLLFCENGFKKDDNGCEICECNEVISCMSDSDCPEGFECQIVNCIDSDERSNCIGGNICIKKQIECEINSDCARGEVCVDGFCKEDICSCPEIYAPVCGENGITYGNACYASCDNVIVLHEGECESPRCDSNDDCEVGLQCIDGVCINYFCPSECQANSDCEEGFFCQPINCLSADGNSGTVCSPIEDICYSDRDCAFGEVCMFLDYAQYGHCISQCEPVYCDLYCENGFKVDERGCQICECNEPQDVCYSDRDCPNGYFCEFLDGCYQDENGEIICIDYGYCVPESSECRVDSDCPELPLPINCLGHWECLQNQCVPTCDQEVCSSDRDCEYGQECVNGVCITNNSCRTDWDCEYGFQCVDSICIPMNNECRVNADCELGLVCVDGVCVSQCEPVYCDLYCENGFKVDQNGCEICECNDVVEFCGGAIGQECPAGYVCEYFDGADFGYCVPSTNECRVNSDCELGLQCINGVCIFQDDRCSSDRDCEYGQECLNGVCITNNSCSHECNSDVECGIGFSCEELDCITYNNQIGSKCVPVEIGCVSDFDCADGESCVQNVCIPEENRCGSDFDCGIGEQCMNGVCVENNSCSHECDSDSDCIGNLIGFCFQLNCQSSDGQNGSMCVTF